jgi:tetratricopeptide (TPR) repeat protein
LKTAAGVLCALLFSGPALADPEPQGVAAERLRTAKELFFDRKYGEARAAWQQVLARSQGAQAATAAYWIARCSESLGELQRAFQEYGELLARKPADRTLAEQARTSRVGLAARLAKDGNDKYRPHLREALDDPSYSVRMVAAIELARLGECERVIPILRRMLSEEKDEDLIQRIRLALLRCDPGALSDVARGPASSGPGGAEARWFKVRIFEKAGSRAKLSLNIPMGLADLAFKSLPEDAREELRKKGYDADNFWERLRRMPPAQILEIEGDEGERIQIWIE